MEKILSRDQLLLELEELRARLYEAEETLRAIRNREVDALVAEGPAGDQVFTLQGAEQPYRVLVETMNEGAATVTPDGTILYCNGQLAEMLRTPLNKVLGRSIHDFIVFQSGQTLEAMLLSCDRAGRRGEFLLKASGGEEIPVLLSVSMLLQDGVEAFCIVATDLTDQKRVQQKLETEIAEHREAEQARVLLMTAIEGAAEAIIITDKAGIMQYANRAFEKITGHAPEGALGEHPGRILDCVSEDGRTVHEIMLDVMQAGRTWTGRLKHRNNKKGICDLDVTILPVTDLFGAVTSHVAIIRDITEDLKLEARVRQAEKLEAIGTLAGGIAHDFNNILAAIIGFTEMVLDDVSENAAVRHKMERVLEASLRGRNLIKQILAFSRRSEGERKEISLTQLLKETHALLRSILPTTIQMPLVVTTGDDHVLADPTQMQQVLMNLATNAAHAMREEGGLLTIGLSSVTLPQGGILPDPDMEPGTYVKLRVTDTGTGMTDEVRRRIFEPFFTTKEAGQGTGMGLAVVYGIVKAHGGALTVRSNVGQGSTFEMFLPRVEKPEAKKEAATASVLPTGTERILFVDDEEMLVEMARGMLQSLGYQVTVAQHGSEAWNLFLADPWGFDLVITDQTMPDVTGVTLAQKMLRVRKDTPIVLCTGYSEMVSAEKAKDVGICEFVMKPMVKKELAETIRRVLDRSHAKV